MATADFFSAEGKADDPPTEANPSAGEHPDGEQGPDSGQIPEGEQCRGDEQPPVVEAPEAADRDATLARIESTVADVRRLVDERLRYDGIKEQAFDRLYKDLEHFRGEAALHQVRPLLLDVILLLDRLDGAMAAPVNSGDPGAFLGSVREELLEILERRGVSSVSNIEEKFDPQVQRAVEVEATSDEAAHNSIARVVRRGYVADDKVLRPEEVVVFRYKAIQQEGVP